MGVLAGLPFLKQPDCFRPLQTILHMKDFTATLHGATIFSKVDLVHVNHQIPVDSDDILKTAVTTLFTLFEFLWMIIGRCNDTKPFQWFRDEEL